MIMTLAEKLLQTFDSLPDDKKREVIDFIEFLKAKNQGELDGMMDAIIAENQEALKELGK